MITDYRPLYSYLILTALGVAVALLDAFWGRRKGPVLGWIAGLGTIAALLVDATCHDARLWNGIVLFDGFSRTFDAVFLVTLALVCIASASSESRMKFAGEYYALLIFSTMGLMLMASAGGLIALYVGLELSTISLFALVGFSKREQRSAEAALKFFVLGAAASAIILYGASLLYGVSANLSGAQGSAQYLSLARAASLATGGNALVLWLGLAFVVGGLAFKIAAVPFHLWAPDVYEGAPTIVTAYLSTASKAAGFAGLLRFLMVALGSASDRWMMIVVVIAALSMVLGNLVALMQTNLKRLLAYSGIAQSGYILVALAGGANVGVSDLATGAILMYLFLYALMNVGGFLIAQAVHDATGSDRVDALRGLHRRSPLLAFSMLIVLFSLGGIPPLAGFVGKLYLFAAGWQGGQYWLVLLGALTSVVALYYYLMVALQVYIRDPADDRKMRVSKPLGAVIGFCVLGTLAIGIYPLPWIRMGDVADAGLKESAKLTTVSVHQASQPPSTGNTTP